MTTENSKPFTIADLGNGMRRPSDHGSALRSALGGAVIPVQAVNATVRKVEEHMAVPAYAIPLIGDDFVILILHEDEIKLLTIEGNGTFIFEELDSTTLDIIRTYLAKGALSKDFPTAIALKLASTGDGRFDNLTIGELFEYQGMLNMLSPALIDGADTHTALSRFRASEFNTRNFRTVGAIPLKYGSAVIFFEHKDDRVEFVTYSREGEVIGTMQATPELNKAIEAWVVLPKESERVEEPIDAAWDHRATYQLLAANAKALSEMSPEEFHNSSLAKQARELLRAIVVEAGL